MKNYKSLLFAGLVIFLASCAQHRTCPTYTKNSVKYVKTATEKI